MQSDQLGNSYSLYARCNYAPCHNSFAIYQVRAEDQIASLAVVLFLQEKMPTYPEQAELQSLNLFFY